MRLLVTGAAGFIGSAFARLAADKYELVIVDSITYAGDIARLKEIDGKYTFYKADISNSEFIEHIFSAEKPQAVIHWAAESHVDRSILDSSPFIKTNVTGTHILLEAARRNGIEKFINIATDEVYGELGETGEFHETTPLNPNSPYSASKTSQDMLGRSYYRTYGLPVVTLRPSNNYGPWQFPEKLVPVVIGKALKGEKIPVYGKGENIREWLYVDDCASAALAALEQAEPGSIYNVGSGQERKNIDTVKFILNALNLSDNLIEFVADRPGHDFRYALNFSKIENELNWKPQINFEIGMIQTVNWYLSNLNWVNGHIERLRSYWAQVYK